MRAWWAVLWALPAFAQTVVDPAISVTDIRGQVVRPFQANGKLASVVFFFTNDCPISNIYAREIHRTCDAYSEYASCVLDYVDPSLTESQVAKHMADYGHGSY